MDGLVEQQSVIVLYVFSQASASSPVVGYSGRGELSYVTQSGKTAIVAISKRKKPKPVKSSEN
jgi:hypothetical protein